MNISYLKEALKYGSETGNPEKHLFQEGRNPEKWDKIRGADDCRAMLDEIIQKGEEYLRSPITALPYSLYKSYAETGCRREFNREYFKRRGRLANIAALVLVFREKRYLEALEDIIWVICDEYTWCLPRHFQGNDSIKVMESLNKMSREDGRIKPHFREHRHGIDLYSAETGFALAEILSLLEDQLAPLVVYRARKEIQSRILESYCELNSSFWWETATHNWAAVCAGSIGAAAMYLIEDDNILAPVLYRLLGTMESFLSGYKDDGVCTEGLGYWNYGFGFYVYFAELLRQRTGGIIDLVQGEKIKQIAMFPQKCYLSENNIVSFSDSDSTYRYTSGLMNYLKQRFNDMEIPDKKYKAYMNDDKCYRWCHFIRNLVWGSSCNCDNSLKEAVYCLKDSKWFISRKYMGKSIVAFAAKGGHNKEPHNHNDLGSFIFHANGETLLADLGAGEYTSQYFGAERYTIFCNGSQGHSVPVIEGCYQQAGSEYCAEITSVNTTEICDALTIDITKAYRVNNLKSLTRSFIFNKMDGGTLVLKDEYRFEKTPFAVTERFITLHKPEHIQKGKIRICGVRGYADIIYNPKAVEYKLSRVDFTSRKAQTVDVYIIDFEVKTDEPEFGVEFTFVAG